MSCWFRFCWLCASVCLLVFPVVGQDFSGEPDRDRKSLRRLDDADYLRRTVELSTAYAQTGDRESAIAFRDLAERRARRVGGPSAVATIHLELAEALLDCCGELAPALELAVASLQATYDNDARHVLNARLATLLTRVNGATKEPTILSKAYALAERISSDGSLVEELRATGKSAAEARSLERQSAQLEQAVRRREAEIQDLSLTAARQRALLEYQQKINDSLRFVGIIDSIQAVQDAQQLEQQAATIQLQESELQLSKARSRTLTVLILAALAVLLLLGGFFLHARQLNRQLRRERDRSEELLLNILPKDVADELKATGNVAPRFYELGTVLFTDFVGFSHIAKSMGSDELIQALDECFQAFDGLAERFQIEKIKTIGDAYMCVGGVPTPDASAVREVIRFALALQKELTTWNAGRQQAGKPVFQARIGIHTGPLVAGVVGIKKFSYDVWGDTVNIAARMESAGAPGKVNVSEATYALVKDDFRFQPRGAVAIKNMPDMPMYFVEA